jgi:hypothetical protein
MTAAAPGFGAANVDATLDRLDRFAYWADGCISIPGLDGRVGLDSIIGLIPGWSDAVGAFFSCYVPYEAYRIGAPPSLIFKMLVRIVAEAVLGTIPVAGDIADALLKTNRINVALLRDPLQG